MTYIARIANVKVDLHSKDEGRRSNGSASRVVTDKRTDATKYGISRLHDALHSIIIISHLESLPGKNSAPSPINRCPSKRAKEPSRENVFLTHPTLVVPNGHVIYFLFTHLIMISVIELS